MHNLPIGIQTRFVTSEGEMTGTVIERTQKNYNVGYFLQLANGDTVHVPAMNIVNPDDVVVRTGGRWHGVCKSVAKRIRIETRIAKSAIRELLAAGYTLGVFDGEETTIDHSTDARAVLDALQTTDDDYLLVYPAEGTLCVKSDCPVTVPGIPHAHPSNRIGWVRFVYGNDGWDVICDYTTNLEDALVQTNALANKIGDTL